MNADVERGRFEVTRHFGLSGRGAFVIGYIVEGMIRVGMVVRTGMDPPVLTISGVEFVDNTAERKSWNALLFADPSLEIIERAFPVGSILDIVSASEAYSSFEVGGMSNR